VNLCSPTTWAVPILLLCMMPPVFAGNEGMMDIPVAAPMVSSTSVSEEDESLYRKVVAVFWSPRGIYLEGRREVPLFSDFAIAAPRLFFSDDHEATSQQIIAAEFMKLLEDGEVSRVWDTCWSLRWVSPHIDLFAPVCRTAGEKAGGQGLGALRHAHHITLSAEPLVLTALQHYLKNPYDAERLKQLIGLITKDHIEVLRSLLKELVQLDPQYLWNRTKESKSLGNWTLYGIEKSLADAP